jgi:hypothetical protein
MRSFDFAQDDTSVGDTVPPCYSCAEVVSKIRDEAECFDSAPAFVN